MKKTIKTLFNSLNFQTYMFSIAIQYQSNQTYQRKRMSKQIIQNNDVILLEDQNKVVSEMKLHLIQYEHSFQQDFYNYDQEQELSNQMEKQDEKLSQDQNSSSDVSFEDEILDQHQTALRIKIKQYQSLFILLSSNIKQNQNLLKNRSFQHHLKQILILFPNSTCQLVQSFQKYLQNNKTLLQFLIHIHYSYQEWISNKLIQLSFMIWNLYRPFVHMSINRREIIYIAKEMATRIVTKENIFQNCTNSSSLQDKKQQRLAFIHFFTSTLLFVIQGYFHNPYQENVIYPRKTARTSPIVTQVEGQDAKELRMSSRKILKAQTC